MLRNITLEKVVRWIIGLTLASAAIWVLVNYSNLLAYAIISIFIAYLLDPLVSWAESKGANRTLAISITLIAFTGLVVWASYNVFPILYSQMVNLASELNTRNIEYIITEVQAVLVARFDFIPQQFLTDNIQNLRERIFDTNQVPDIVAGAFGIFTNVFSAILVIPFATFFFLKDGAKIRRDILQLIPNKYFETTLTVINKIENRLGTYFKSVLFQSFVVATLSVIGLSIVGLNNALSVGITMGLANSIPYLGPIIGYLLSFSVSIVETQGDFNLAFACMAVVFVVQIIDNSLLQPLIFSKSADIHPVAVLFIILIGAETAGLLGMLFAIPIATSVKIMIQQISWSFNNYKVFLTD